MFMFDIETLGVESTSVILSAALIHFEIGKDYTYEELLENSLFVKINVQQQIKELKRVAQKDTIDWWAKQHEHVRNVSLKPLPLDISPLEAVRSLHEYASQFPEKDQTVWARGSLDQMCIDSLSRQVDQELIFPYNNWRDMRTAIDLLKDTGKNGYCDIIHPTFKSHNVIKHHPVHDCALDIMMLIYGK
jgi:hypothetical protein